MYLQHSASVQWEHSYWNEKWSKLHIKRKNRLRTLNVRQKHAWVPYLLDCLRASRYILYVYTCVHCPIKLRNVHFVNVCVVPSLDTYKASFTCLSVCVCVWQSLISVDLSPWAASLIHCVGCLQSSISPTALPGHIHLRSARCCSNCVTTIRVCVCVCVRVCVCVCVCVCVRQRESEGERMHSSWLVCMCFWLTMWQPWVSAGLMIFIYPSVLCGDYLSVCCLEVGAFAFRGHSRWPSFTTDTEFVFTLSW